MSSARRTISFVLSLAIGGLISVGLLCAQPSHRPAFEIASIKPTGPDEPLMYRLQPGGHYVAKGVTLRALVSNAYSVPAFLISGGPSWSNSAKFNIEALVGHALPPWPDSNREVSLMLQSLLEDRFQFASHRETKENRIYELRLAKSGTPLKLAGPEETSGFEMVPGRIHSLAVPLSVLAQNLAYLLGRTVVDRTGLDGKFSFNINYTPDNVVPTDTAAPALVTALREQLGVVLQPATGPVELLVIDRVELPSGN